MLQRKGAEYRAIVTHLEMCAPPNIAPRWPHQNLTLQEAERPDIQLYRHIYDQIGRPYHWVNRRYISDYMLKQILHHPKNHVFYLYENDQIIGFTEVNARRFPLIELVFVGLKESAIGKGYGKGLLHHTLDFIWSQTPERVIIQTNTLDNPAALNLYQKSGFTPFDREEVTIIDRG